MLYAVVMAGGQGTRLWPESQKNRPKQFLAFKNDRPLVLDACESLYGVVPPSNVLVVTGKTMVPLLAEAVPWLRNENILIEPVPRNTAPCIGLAAVFLLQNDPEATMIVLPSDHLIEPHRVFRQTVQFAAELVEESSERLVTIGIPPIFPAVSYGYIECGLPLESPIASKWADLASVSHVLRFHEKPNQQAAEQFVVSNRYHWNAGIFVWKAKRILELINQFQPEMGLHLEKIAQSVRSQDFPTILKQEFETIKGISIDYAVLERAESIVTINAPFQWDDIGTWCALDRINQGKHDQFGNLVNNCHLIAIDSYNNIVRCQHSDVPIALFGVDNLIVVQTDHGTLIAKKEDEEKVRQIIEQLKPN